MVYSWLRCKPTNETHHEELLNVLMFCKEAIPNQQDVMHSTHNSIVSNAIGVSVPNTYSPFDYNQNVQFPASIPNLYLTPPPLHLSQFVSIPQIIPLQIITNICNDLIVFNCNQ